MFAIKNISCIFALEFARLYLTGTEVSKDTTLHKGIVSLYFTYLGICCKSLATSGELCPLFCYSIFFNNLKF